jgi:glycosyltransferase involved in cell wall biosynthesis
MTKRITFVVQTPEFGGAEKHLSELLRRIDESVECVILCFGEDFYTEAMRGKANVRVIKLPQIKTHKLISFWKVFSRYPADVIVLVKGIFEQYPLSAYVAARMSRTGRLIALEHNVPNPLPDRVIDGGVFGAVRRLFGWRTRYLLAGKIKGRLSHITVCVSEAIRRRLTQDFGYPEDRTITIRNGIDLGYYSTDEMNEIRLKGSASAQNGTPKTIVCAARLSRAKRLDLLLEALALLVRSHSDWRCLILGAGPLEEELREQARRLGLNQFVTFVGHVADVRPYLRTADLFVLSSEKEGLPLALLEAMAFGVPAVVTDVGGNGEVIVHGQNGLLVKARSVGDLEGAINYLLIHHEERRRMSEAARLHIQQHFNIEESMARLKQVVCPPVPSELS